MKSLVAAGFSAPDFAVEGLLCFISGNLKALLEIVLHVQSSNGY
jgi:hypothetical protein